MFGYRSVGGGTREGAFWFGNEDIARVSRILSALPSECLRMHKHDVFQWELLQKTCFHWRDLTGKLPWKEFEGNAAALGSLESTIKGKSLPVV